MPPLLAAAGACLLLSLAPGLAHGQSPAESGAPAGTRTYALVAAVGDEIAMVTATARTGTHLSPYRRDAFDAPNGALDRLVLNGLDGAIAKLDPDSRRVYMVLNPGQLKDVAPPQRESAAMGKIVSALERMHERRDWNFIVVVTPTYTGRAIEGLPGKMQGPGVFVEPMCQGRTGKRASDPDTCRTDAPPLSGPEAVTPSGENIRTNFFVAPFFYMQVWVLDAKTFAVIDRQKMYDSTKLYDRDAGRQAMVSPEILEARFAGLIGNAVRGAVLDTVLRGKVEVGTIREVPPDETSK